MEGKIKFRCPHGNLLMFSLQHLIHRAFSCRSQWRTIALTAGRLFFVNPPQVTNPGLLCGSVIQELSSTLPRCLIAFVLAA